ncbi:DEP domain-containing protein 1A-like isoform X2 [Patiria miniata]|uniref:DEP domain-containing protein n=1 Tax=Patiria miniata TaxID=46514 RepID=A0A914AYN1_PATMI|nr:DEP domain-containing protein 1A-like isoform X2 [Patiria miniata]
MDPPHLCGEPFKATKLWNMIIRDFRAGMPLKRHRKGLRGRHHDNCFTSTEAIDWLHDYLQNCDRFGPWVTRAQTVSLLEKFLHSKVVQGVKGSTKSSPVKFEDNGDLYKFVPVSPMKKLRSALSSRSNLRTARTPLKTLNSEPMSRTLSYDNPAFSAQDADRESAGQGKGKGGGPSRGLPQCRLVQRPLTPAQREEVWKSATLNRLQRLLWLTSLDGLLDAGLVSAKHIMHSCTHVSRNGVVLVPKDQDDLPHWVLSAMKCLANWPNSPDSGLPNYPGFERDVFKTISSYFLGLSQPLLTFHLYDLIVESFVTAERRDRGLYPGAEPLTTPPQTIQGLTSFESVENLMLNMTSAGMFGLSPELAGAPERARGAIDRKGRFAEDAMSKRLKLMDGRKWIGDVRGIPPSTTAFHIEAEGGHGSSGRSSDALRGSCSPPSRRGKRGIQRSSSMSVTGFTRPNSDGNQQPVDGDGKHSSIQPQGMRRCISEPTTGCQGIKQNYPVRVPRESPPITSSNRMESGWQHNQEPPRENHGSRHQQHLHQRHRPLSAPVQQRTPKFPSASNLHVPEHHQREIPGLGGKSRKFTSQIIISDKGKGTSSSTHRPMTGFASSQTRPSTETSSSSKDLNYGFPLQYPDPATNTRRGFGSMNDIGNALKSNQTECPPKETHTRNLFVSKRFGSASELIQKIFKKKSSSREADAPRQPISLGHQLRGSTPNLVHQQTQQPSNSIPNLDRATPPNPTTVTNINDRQQDRISPSYPPPLRATLSYSDIGSSRENSASHTPDSHPQVNGLRSGSSSDVRSTAKVESSAGYQKMKRSDSTASLYLSDDKSYTEEALRLCCLLLPPVNRRKLHLLLKLMTKMEANPELVLSSRKTTRQLVLETFSRAILCSQEEIDYNETLASRIVEYLMDNHGNVFTQPEELKADIQDRLVYLGRSQIKYVTETENQTATAPSYCQKMSVEQYEAQKLSNSQRAVADLLEVIIRDHNMPAKDKKKKLKQFQKTYPDIYARRLPTTASEAELFPDKPKIKQPMTNVRKSVTKLKSLR